MVWNVKSSKTKQWRNSKGNFYGTTPASCQSCRHGFSSSLGERLKAGTRRPGRYKVGGNHSTERLGRKNWGSGAKDQLSFANDRMDGNRDRSVQGQWSMVLLLLVSPNTFQVHRRISFFPHAQWESFLTYFNSFCSHTLPPVTHVQLCSQNTHCLSLRTLVPKTFIALRFSYLKTLLLLVSMISNKFKTLKQNSSF